MKQIRYYICLPLFVLSFLLSGCEPIVTITSPSDGGSFYVGDGVLFIGTARDILERQLPEDACVWTSDRDGEIGIGTEFISYDLSSSGGHIITLTARNSWGVEGRATVTIYISEKELFPILATILSPTDGGQFEVGESITFNGYAYDINGEDLTGDSLIWTSDTDGEIGKGTTFTKNDLAEGIHTITLSATNSLGHSDTDSVSITIG